MPKLKAFSSGLLGLAAFTYCVSVGLSGWLETDGFIGEAENEHKGVEFGKLRE